MVIEAEVARSHQRTYQRWWLWPAVVCTFAVALAGGAFIGRVNTVQCDRQRDVCELESKSYLYVVTSEEVPLSKVSAFRVNVKQSDSEVRRPRRRISWTSFNAALIVDGSPSAQRLPITLEVYDSFSYVEPVLAAADELQSFLEDETQKIVKVEFGTHRSAVLFTALLLGLGFGFAFRLGRFRLNIDATPEVSERPYLDEGTGQRPPFHRTKIDLSVNGSRFSQRATLYSNSNVTVDQKVVFASPDGEIEESVFPLPGTLPKEARDEILSLLRSERDRILGPREATPALSRALDERARGDAEEMHEHTRQRRRGLFRSWLPATAALLFAGGIYFYVENEISWSEAATRADASLLNDPTTNGRRELDVLVADYQKRGCVLISPPASQSRHSGGFFAAPAGGKCVHLLAAASQDQSLSAEFSRGGTRVVKKRGGAADLEHCPTADVRLDWSVTNSVGGPVSHALVECEPPAEFHPRASGFHRVVNAVHTLHSLGCQKVLLPPKQVTGEQDMQAQVMSAGQCMNVLLTSGVEGSSFSIEVKEPLGSELVSMKDAKEAHLALCSREGGPHSVRVTPKTPDYYTMMAVSCPLAVTNRWKRQFEAASPHATANLAHLIP